MTVARFERSQNTDRLTVEGHQPGMKGYDIYCAAASAIACTLAEALAQEEDAQMVQRMTDGRMEITALRTMRGDAMFDMAKAGFERLAEKWPDRFGFE